MRIWFSLRHPRTQAGNPYTTPRKSMLRYRKSPTFTGRTILGSARRIILLGSARTSIYSTEKLLLHINKLLLHINKNHRWSKSSMIQNCFHCKTCPRRCKFADGAYVQVTTGGGEGAADADFKQARRCMRSRCCPFSHELEGQAASEVAGIRDAEHIRK